jgi:hypothetical protein
MLYPASVHIHVPQTSNVNVLYGHFNDSISVTVISTGLGLGSYGFIHFPVFAPTSLDETPYHKVIEELCLGCIQQQYRPKTLCIANIHRNQYRCIRLPGTVCWRGRHAVVRASPPSVISQSINRCCICPPYVRYLCTSVFDIQ